MSVFEKHRERGDDDFDPIRAMSALDSTKRKNIVGTIVGHPTGTPSRKELEYYNPSIPATTLSSNLRSLEDAGVVQSAEKDREDLPRGASYRFFRLTDQARELFDQTNLFEESAYKNLFDQTQKTEAIEQAEAATRPEFE